MTWQFSDKIDNYLFRNLLYKNKISYEITGYINTTYIIIEKVDFEKYFSKFVI